MIIYCERKKQFDQDVKSGIIADKLKDLFKQNGLDEISEGEYNSWKNSLPYMQRLLNDSEFSDDLQIALEYQLRQMSNRVDFIVAGEDKDGNANIVIVELKQWSSENIEIKDDLIKVFIGDRFHFLTHPSYQAFRYAKSFECGNEAVREKNISVHSCAYLHNFDSPYIKNITESLREASPVFIENEEAEMRAYLKKYVFKSSERDIIGEIDSGKISSSKALQDVVVSMIRGNEEFILSGEQKTVHDSVMMFVRDGLHGDKKHTIIVRGGPGTGKSVVAIQLIASLMADSNIENKNFCYVTKNKAPRKVFSSMVVSDKIEGVAAEDLFKSSYAFGRAKSNQYGCIIVDEAHRLTMPEYGNKSQVEQIINAAKVSVFFVDERQIVSAQDIGTVKEIWRCAKKYESGIFCNESTVLTSQFRCNGSDEYIAFLDNLFDYERSKKCNLSNLSYDIKVFDNPVEMREQLRIKNRASNKARMLAGFCYAWKSRLKDERGPYDIILPGGFQAHWNFENEKIWAIDESSFEQVGCIHTAQGLEFEYAGVIIGNDLRYVDGKVITDRSLHPSGDRSFTMNNNKLCSDDLADMIIRNTYKVLMTRGQKGCYIYCEDEALREYIKDCLKA